MFPEYDQAFFGDMACFNLMNISYVTELEIWNLTSFMTDAILFEPLDNDDGDLLTSISFGCVEYDPMQMGKRATLFLKKEWFFQFLFSFYDTFQFLGITGKISAKNNTKI